MNNMKDLSSKYLAHKILQNSIENIETYCLLKKIIEYQLCLVFYQSCSLTNQKTCKHCPILITGNTAEIICKLFELHPQIRKNLSISHALYLGRELIKLELAFIMKQDYIQS